GRHGDDLLRRHIHIVDVIARHERELALRAARNQLVYQLTRGTGARVGLRDRKLAFLDRRQIVDAIAHAPALYPPVRRLEKAVLIGTGVHRERVDQTDVRTFRRLDRADAPVVRRVHVAHLESRPLARQAAWPERRDTPLVRDL